MNTPTTIEVNGPAIREIRLRSGLGVSQLADAVGVKRPYVAKIELGHSRRVSPAVFNRLIAALSVQDRRAIMANPYGSADVEAAA
ncbi:helix-turn-helix domain-containing protein [Isoptericola sp. NPDC055881]